jgi:hypothetical protein
MVSGRWAERESRDMSRSKPGAALQWFCGFLADDVGARAAFSIRTLCSEPARRGLEIGALAVRAKKEPPVNGGFKS